MHEVRLIDANELKRAFEKVYPLATNEMGGVVNKQIYDIIDNAPTVEINTNDIEYKAYCKGLEDGKKIARPQGKWIKWNFKTFGAMGDWEYKCSNCEKVYGGEYNFCPNCGEEMQKGEEA